MARQDILSGGDLADHPAGNTDFVIESWRALALGSADAPKLLRQFRRHCGAATKAVFEHYFVFFHILGRDSRRRLRVGHSGCPGMTPDEMQVLALLAAAQTGHGTLFDAHLCWLVPNGLRCRLAVAAMGLADALSGCGIDLSGGLHNTSAPVSASSGLSLVRH